MKKIALLLLWAGLVGAVSGQTPPTVPASDTAPALNMDAVKQDMVTIFNPRFITNPGSELNNACERVMLICQAISVTIIVAGMIQKLRKDETQMEGVASMMLKVAFIASIPFWRTFTLDTADIIADSVGYRAVNYGTRMATAPSPIMGRMFDMAAQWMPPSTPAHDATEAAQPAPGQEQGWMTRAWNWAKGVASATANMVDNIWQAFTGALRSLFILLMCVVVSVVVIILIVLTYIAELIRYFLFYVGCALLPIFIAGLGVELLKQQSTRFILGLVSVALWPVGWALANILTSVMIWGATTWMAKLAAAALGAAAVGTVAPPLAAAAPFLGWGILFILVGLTLAIVIFSLVGLVLAPYGMGKMVTSGAHMFGGMIGAGIAGTAAAGAAVAGIAATMATGGAAAPAAGGAAVGGGGVLGKAAGGAAGLFGRAAQGAASLAGKVGGARVGSAASNLASGMSRVVSTAASQVSTASMLRGMSSMMSMASRVNPERQNDAGQHIGTGLAVMSGLGSGSRGAAPSTNAGRSQSAAASWLPGKRRP
jgi:hypothetical protein